MEAEGRRSAFPLLQKVHHMLTLTRTHAHTLNYYEVSQTNISTGPTVIKQVINTVVVVHCERECTWEWKGREWGIYLHDTENMVRICQNEGGGKLIDSNGNPKNQWGVWKHMLKLKTENAFSVISRPSLYRLHVPFVQKVIHLLVKVKLC